MKFVKSGLHKKILKNIENENIFSKEDPLKILSSLGLRPYKHTKSLEIKNCLDPPLEDPFFSLLAFQKLYENF